MIVSFAAVPLRADLPTDLRVVDLTVIFLRALQFLNAFAPILVIFLPIVTDVSFLQPLNALAAIPVTLYALPSTVTVAGILTDLAFFLTVPANTAVASELILYVLEPAV